MFQATDANSIASQLEIQHAVRLTRYQRNWNFYKGNQWDYARGEDDPFVTINYLKKIVQRHISFFLGKGFKVVVPDLPDTPEDESTAREFVRSMLEETWRRNRIGRFCLEAGQIGGITGDVFCFVSWEANDPIEDPYARVDVLPSQFVFPTYGGPYGVDRKRMEAVTIVYPYFVDAGQVDKITGLPAKKTAIRVETWTREKHTIYNDDGKGIKSEEPNLFGEIPVVHIANYPIAGEEYGESDIDALITIQREFNEKATDISDVVNYHGSPITLLYGMKLSAVEKGANRMWGIENPDARVENLELKGDMALSKGYMELIRSSLLELADLPKDALMADSSGTAANMSGVALAMHFLPLLWRRNDKIQTYGEGLRLINRLMLKYTDLKDDKFHKEFRKITAAKYRTEIVFPDPLPRDESLRLQQVERRLKNRIASRRQVLEEDGFSQRQAEKILQEADKDAEMEAKLVQMTKPQAAIGPNGEQMPRKEQENRGGNSSPATPEPNAQGESRSRSAEGV